MVKKPQFSLRVVLTLVAVIAIICEALIRPTTTWFVVIATASLACIMFAVLAAIYGSGLVRAFWLGFAIASLGQLGIEKLANSRRMPTEQVTDYLDKVIHPELVEDPEDPFGEAVDVAERRSFELAAFWIWPSLFGFAGGLVARRLYAARQGQGHR